MSRAGSTANTASFSADADATGCSAATVTAMNAAPATQPSAAAAAAATDSSEPAGLANHTASREGGDAGGDHGHSVRAGPPAAPTPSQGERYRRIAR